MKVNDGDTVATRTLDEGYRALKERIESRGPNMAQFLLEDASTHPGFTRIDSRESRPFTGQSNIASRINTPFNQRKINLLPPLPESKKHQSHPPQQEPSQRQQPPAAKPVPLHSLQRSHQRSHITPSPSISKLPSHASRPSRRQPPASLDSLDVTLKRTLDRIKRNHSKLSLSHQSHPENAEAEEEEEGQTEVNKSTRKKNRTTAKPSNKSNKPLSANNILAHPLLSRSSDAVLKDTPMMAPKDLAHIIALSESIQSPKHVSPSTQRRAGHLVTPLDTSKLTESVTVQSNSFVPRHLLPKRHTRSVLTFPDPEKIAHLKVDKRVGVKLAYVRSQLNLHGSPDCTETTKDTVKYRLRKVDSAMRLKVPEQPLVIDHAKKQAVLKKSKSLPSDVTIDLRPNVVNLSALRSRAFGLISGAGSQLLNELWQKSSLKQRMQYVLRDEAVAELEYQVRSEIRRLKLAHDEDHENELVREQIREYLGNERDFVKENMTTEALRSSSLEARQERIQEFMHESHLRHARAWCMRREQRARRRAYLEQIEFTAEFEKLHRDLAQFVGNGNNYYAQRLYEIFPQMFDKDNQEEDNGEESEVSSRFERAVRESLNLDTLLKVRANIRSVAPAGKVVPREVLDRLERARLMDLEDERLRCLRLEEEERAKREHEKEQQAKVVKLMQEYQKSRQSETAKSEVARSEAATFREMARSEMARGEMPSEEEEETPRSDTASKETDTSRRDNFTPSVAYRSEFRWPGDESSDDISDDEAGHSKTSSIHASPVRAVTLKSPPASNLTPKVRWRDMADEEAVLHGQVLVTGESVDSRWMRPQKWWSLIVLLEFLRKMTLNLDNYRRDPETTRRQLEASNHKVMDPVRRMILRINMKRWRACSFILYLYNIVKKRKRAAHTILVFLVKTRFIQSVNTAFRRYSQCTAIAKQVLHRAGVRRMLFEKEVMYRWRTIEFALIRNTPMHVISNFTDPLSTIPPTLILVPEEIAVLKSQAPNVYHQLYGVRRRSSIFSNSSFSAVAASDGVDLVGLSSVFTVSVDEYKEKLERYMVPASIRERVLNESYLRRSKQYRLQLEVHRKECEEYEKHQSGYKEYFDTFMGKGSRGGRMRERFESEIRRVSRPPRMPSAPWKLTAGELERLVHYAREVAREDSAEFIHSYGDKQWN